MRSAISRERGVETDDAGGSAVFDPFDQVLATPDAQPAEIDEAKLGATAFAQARDTLQGLDVVVEKRADKDADLQIGAFGLPPIVKAVDQRFETRERQATALPRLRDQAIAADMGAWRVPQRKPQLLSGNFLRYGKPRDTYSKPTTDRQKGQ
jgi:hypothetical protein